MECRATLLVRPIDAAADGAAVMTEPIGQAVHAVGGHDVQGRGVADDRRRREGGHGPVRAVGDEQLGDGAVAVGQRQHQGSREGPVGWLRARDDTGGAAEARLGTDQGGEVTRRAEAGQGHGGVESGGQWRCGVGHDGAREELARSRGWVGCRDGEQLLQRLGGVMVVVAV